jgi:hypothetical protein
VDPQFLDASKTISDASFTDTRHSETEIAIGGRYPVVAQHDMVESFDWYIQFQFL